MEQNQTKICKNCSNGEAIVFPSIYRCKIHNKTMIYTDTCLDYIERVTNKDFNDIFNATYRGAK